MPEPKETTHTLIERELIVYRRERSGIWQCRYKVDGVWQRASTKERDLKNAKARAHELRMEAEIRRRSNLPVITRKFRDVARLAVERLEHEIAVGKGKRSYTDYIRVINDYLIPILGKKSITSIDYQALDELNGPSQKSRQIQSLKYAFTLGNENDKSYQSPEEEGMH